MPDANKKSSRESIAHAAAIVGIISLPISIVACFLSWLSWKSAWDIAEISGALDKPILTLGIAGIHPSATGKISIVLGMPPPDKSDTVTIGSIPFSMGNEGNKTIDFATLTFRTHLLMKRKSIDDLLHLSNPVPSIIDIRHTLNDDSQFSYSTYQVTRLDPRVGVTIDEPLQLRETKFDVDVPITTKDRAQAVASYSVYYSIQSLVTLSGRDIPTINYELDLATTYGSSLEELKIFVEKYHVKRELEDIRSKLTFWQYFGGLIFRRDINSIFLIIDEFDAHELDKDGILRLSKGKHQVGRVDYDILNWALLFR